MKKELTLAEKEERLNTFVVGSMDVLRVKTRYPGYRAFKTLYHREHNTSLKITRTKDLYHMQLQTRLNISRPLYKGDRIDVCFTLPYAHMLLLCCLRPLLDNAIFHYQETVAPIWLNKRFIDINPEFRSNMFTPENALTQERKQLQKAIQDGIREAAADRDGQEV